MPLDIALIGYGEVGRILAEDLRAQAQAVWAFDLKLNDARGDAMRAHAAAHGVALTASHAAAVRGAALVISAVTASQAVAVAQACAPALLPGAYFLDFNSASPLAKIEAARAGPLRVRRIDEELRGGLRRWLSCKSSCSMRAEPNALRAKRRATDPQQPSAGIPPPERFGS